MDWCHGKLRHHYVVAAMPQNCCHARGGASQQQKHFTRHRVAAMPLKCCHAAVPKTRKRQYRCMKWCHGKLTLHVVLV
jgi:hypothetical protein